MYANVAVTLDLTWLLAGTQYTIAGYVDNRLMTNTTTFESNSVSFTTTAVSPIYTHKTTFAGTIAKSLGENIKNSLAKSLGINPNWLANQKFVSNSRMLQDGTTEITHYVLTDRSISDITPSVIFAAVDQAAAKDDLAEIAGSKPSFTNTLLATGSAPAWTTIPVISSVGSSTAEFVATSTLNGVICALCADPTLTGIQYAWQILVGIDSATSLAPSNCQDALSNSATTITVSGLKGGTKYDCWFTACNDYPLWPACLEATSNLALDKVSIETEQSSDSTSSATVLQVVFSLFLAFS